MHQTFSQLIWNIIQWIWSKVSHNTTYFWREIDIIVYSLMLSATPPQKNGVGENDLHDHCTNKTNDSYVQSSKIDIAQNGIYTVKWQFLIGCGRQMVLTNITENILSKYFNVHLNLKIILSYLNHLNDGYEYDIFWEKNGRRWKLNRAGALSFFY